MPPEQALGKRSVIDPHSDVCVMGALLYHLLTGRAPSAAETVT
jgi:eukaryotic-like serine/threonine-protein kinase